jgi:hypothetical protein
MGEMTEDREIDGHFQTADKIGCHTQGLIRDRIKELRRVRAKDLLPNPKNWRRHPKAQAAALRGLLAEVGYADALLVRTLPDGRLMIIDGHLRAETTPDALVPVLVLDVTEGEADKILLTLDPLGSMAESDAERIEALLTTVRTDSAAVQELLKRIAGPKLWEILHPEDVEEAAVSLDRADELKDKWGTDIGQLWRIGPHRIICGDGTNIDSGNLSATISFISPQAEYTPPLIYSESSKAKLVFLIEARPPADEAVGLNPGQPIEVRPTGTRTP